MLKPMPDEFNANPMIIQPTNIQLNRIRNTDYWITGLGKVTIKKSIIFYY